MQTKTFSVSYIGRDLLIGVLIAAISIPISMGYAMVAGLPAVYGLYGSFLPILIYGLLTSSPRFVFGVDAAPAALMGALLASLGIEAGSENAVRIAPMITILVAIWLLLLFLLSANRLLRFISQPVMGGFITGIGITIILMQIPKLFGGTAGSGEAPELIRHILTSAGEGFHVLSFLLGLGTVLLILLCRHFLPKLPMTAIVMVAGAVLSAILPLKENGVAMLPSVSSGLPSITIPDFHMLELEPRTILLSTFTIAVVILSETLLASRSNAINDGYDLNTRKEVLAYSLANFASAMFGCCPVNASVSRTSIVRQWNTALLVSAGSDSDRYRDLGADRNLRVRTCRKAAEG